MSNNEQRLAKARDLFTKLQLPGWKEHTAQLRPGGQATVLVVTHESGERGVFRCLTETNERASKRFEREIKILTDPKLRHPNIVEILCSPTDVSEPWYISRLHHPFLGRWKKYREQHANDPELVLSTAVNVIAMMADGLSLLHDNGIVHRDIKPANIVVNSEDGEIIPILIDFGIAFTHATERLTPVNEAVGTKRYSPDIVMNRLEQVLPWLDVFHLAQVLIWMVQTPSAMSHWDRPLDYRYVNYDDGLSTNSVRALRAVTAVCSEQDLAPQNGRELASLLRERFPSSDSSTTTLSEIDLQSIKQGRATGKAIRDLEHAETLKAIEVCAAGIEIVYSMLRIEIDTLYFMLKKHGVDVAKSIDIGFDDFIRSLKTVPNASVEATFYQMDFTAESGKAFHFRIAAVAFIPRVRQKISGPLPPETSNVICLYLQMFADGTFPSVTEVVTLERDGALMRRTERMAAIEKTDAQKLATMIQGWVTKAEVWEAIERT